MIDKLRQSAERTPVADAVFTVLYTVTQNCLTTATTLCPSLSQMCLYETRPSSLAQG